MPGVFATERAGYVYRQAITSAGTGTVATSPDIPFLRQRKAWSDSIVRRPVIMSGFAKPGKQEEGRAAWRGSH